MKYFSTRGDGRRVTSSETILQGLAADGGLFVPEEIPQVEPEFIKELAPVSYEIRAAEILGLLLDDYDSLELATCLFHAYGGNKFDGTQKAPLVYPAVDTAVLELWHGPTSAFKDMALQLLPHLITCALKKNNIREDLLILVATSGDTGKAALAGFSDVARTKVQVFYPADGVSEMQRRQMVTTPGKNVQVTAVKGNFDDAQTGVKEIFHDANFAAKLGAAGVKLSSANSINWGRLAPQIVYYFSAYADMLAAERITMGEKVNFVVPTGNFGDILAGFYAKMMGLPVGKLICASNANDVLTEFLRTGVYNAKRNFYKTISPSMDILVSSNLERLLYHLTQDTATVSNRMAELARTGRYEVSAAVLAKLQEHFWAGSANDAETKATIKHTFDAWNYLADPHTAVALKVAADYRQATGDKRHMVILSTASPYKFCSDVLDALQIEATGLDDFAKLDKLSQISRTTAPRNLASLKDAAVRFTAVVDKTEMAQATENFARA